MAEDGAWIPWPFCPAEECEEVRDITIMECAPGRTYITIGGICHHTVFLHRAPDSEMTDDQRKLWQEYFRPSDVPRETKEGS